MYTKVPCKDKVWGKEKEIFVLKVVISQWKRKKTRDKLKMGTDNWKRCFQGQKWVNWGRDCKEGMTIKSVSGLKRYSRGTNEGNAMEVTVITNQNEVRMVKLIWERTSR